MVKLKLLNEKHEEICELIKPVPVKEDEELWAEEKKYKVLKILHFSENMSEMTILVKEIMMFPFMQKDGYQPPKFIYWEQ